MLFLAFSGPFSRFTTITEDYVLTGLLLALGYCLCQRSRETEQPAPLRLALVITGIAVTFDPLAILMAVYLVAPALERLKRRDFMTAAIGCCVVATVGIGVLTQVARSGIGYENLHWGGYLPSPANVAIFLRSAGRLLVYVIAPSMALLRQPWMLMLLVVAMLSGGCFLGILGLSVAKAKSDPASTVPARLLWFGLLARCALAFWWQPSNTEQLIGPFILGVVVATNGVLHDREGRHVFFRAIAPAAALSVGVANWAIVGVPAFRYESKYPSILKHIGSISSPAEPTCAAVLTEDENVRVYQRCGGVLASTDKHDASHFETLTFNMQAIAPGTEAEFDQILKTVRREVDDRLKHGCVVNRYGESPLGRKVHAFRLMNYLASNYQMESMEKLTEGFHLHRLTAHL